MWYAVLIACLSVVLAKPEYMPRKLCKDVDKAQCTLRNVFVDPCTSGSGFCILKRNKSYTVSLDLGKPGFWACMNVPPLKLAISADVDGSGNFTTSIKTPVNACNMLYCPLQTEERRIFDVSLMLDKRASGKFPVKVKMWNEDNESQACCVTFNVKVSK